MTLASPLDSASFRAGPSGQGRPPEHGQLENASWVRPVLARLGVAISRRRAYTAAHPMVQQAEDALAQEILPLVEGGHIIALGVAHKELLVDGVPVESGSAVTRDLATRLYRRGVGALTIQRGATAEGLRTLLGWITKDVDDSDPEPPPVLPGITVGRIAYDRLALFDDERFRAEIDGLWRSLAEAAFEEDRQWQQVPNAPLEHATANEVGDAIKAKVGTRRYAEKVGFVIGSVAAQVSKAPSGVRDEVGERLQRVMQRIGASSISAVVDAVGRGREQRRFLASMCDALPMQAVVEWLEVAGRATNQELSHHLIRILSKLSMHAGSARAQAGLSDELRDAARDLVQSWELGDPNPAEHAALLDQIAMLGATDAAAANITVTVVSAASGTMTESVLADSAAEAARIVQMACEIDVASEDAIAAVEALVGQGYARELLVWLDAAADTETARRLRMQMLAPAALSKALLADPFNADAAAYMLEAVDSSHIPLLLDTLQAATSRDARRLIYKRLRAEGPALYPELSRRLYDRPAWYFIRNLLSLLRDVGARLGGSEGGIWTSDVAAYQSHTREQVRLEALRLLVSDNWARDAAICRALDDTSALVLTAAVEAAHRWVTGQVPVRGDDDLSDDELSPAIAPSPRGGGRTLLSRDVATRLMRVVDEGQIDETTTVLAIECLRNVPGPTVRSWLLQIASARTAVLRRVTLAPLRPRVMAAVALLHDQYAADPIVAKLLKVAGKALPRVQSSPAARRTTPEPSWVELEP